jgi:serine protease Do
MRAADGKRRRRGGWVRSPLAFALALLLGLAASAFPAAPTPAASHAPKLVPQGRAQLTFSFAPVVKRVAPAVVNIYTRTVVEQPKSAIFSDPFFRRFFGDELAGTPQRRVEQALGSGVLVGANGTVVTNFHVIKGADQITVVLSDRREFPAKVVGTDDRADLAVLKIDAGAEPLPVLELGDSDAIEVGDLVLAIGNPFGVGQTVTSGIISALARTAIGAANYDFFIQTDAAINPGNSGGALVTMDGKLIGVNAAIYSSSGGSVGIGFAIPANMVRTVIANILAGGKLPRPWLGVNGQSVTPDIASSLGLSRPAGVLVTALYDGGPAAKAGLRTGDVVIKMDGREVDDAEALRYRVATRMVGSAAALGLFRKGDQLTISVPLAPPPETVPRDETNVTGDTPLTGITVANLSPALAEEIGADSFARGVIVTKVQSDSPADKLGFKLGDILLRLNGVEIGKVATLKEQIAGQPSGWKLSVRRGDRVIDVVIGS